MRRERQIFPNTDGFRIISHPCQSDGTSATGPAIANVLEWIEREPRRVHALEGNDGWG